ncbi:PQQ-binding-like beta-propeller repeat protein [Streptomyces novaecaesareae]|uniref:outer membrane protein assembly factor BamB family protein n=1 Tax=Streptomyces novaecaesareae TaxID=68244 RepID=UPI00052446F6|nr:PQQ-binding-like beta-propeller repeat protein [Streptomyces novaecaesareae]
MPATPPAPPRINRRRLLLSAAGGLGALAVCGGAGWWARRDTARGPRLWGSAALGGRVVLPAGARQGLYASGYDGSVRAIDPGSGAVLWSREIGAADPDGGSPGWQLADSGGWPLASGDGVVCVVSQARVQARVQVLDAASGDLRWEVALPDWAPSAWQQDPAVGGGGVYTVHGSSLHCHDTADGALRWSSDPGVSGRLALAGDTVFAAGERSGLLAFDARGGERRWAQAAVGRANGAPVVERGVVYVAQSGEGPGSATVFALDAASGQVLWRRGRMDVPQGPLSAADRTLCLLSGARLTALDAATGETRWTAAVPVGLGRGTGSMTAADGTAYVGTNDDRLFAFDLATGRLRWQDEPEHLDAAGEYTRVFLAAAGSAVFRGSRTGLHALGALPSA